ncbi:MAG TPA: CoA-binding protein, partial [Rhodocyclaceae bacterium]|nr:CoA-binding protein [Rhodocyclaceae bacterium]
MNRSLLAGLVSPTAVALFGANPDDHSLGGALTRNLLEGGYAGEVYLINPKHREIRGRACHPSLDAIDARIDLALIVTPADGVAGIVEQCGKKRIRHAVVHSAGFAEAGEFGALVQTNLMETARRCGVRIMGPRALGFIRPSLGLNATLFYRRIPAGKRVEQARLAGIGRTGQHDLVAGPVDLAAMGVGEMRFQRGGELGDLRGRLTDRIRGNVALVGEIDGGFDQALRLEQRRAPAVVQPVKRTGGL